MDPFEHANASVFGPGRDLGRDDGLEGPFSRFGTVRGPQVERVERLVRERRPGQHILPEPEGLEHLTDKDKALANAIGRQVAQFLRLSPSTPVRLPAHTCAPVRALDFDAPLRAGTAPVTIAPGATTTVASKRLNPGWYGSLLGFAWTVAWTAGGAPADPYLSAQMTLSVNGRPHPEYFNVVRQLTNSLLFLIPVTWPIDTLHAPKEGSLIEISVENINGGGLSIDVAGRVKGYQFPVGAADEGIMGGFTGG